MNLNNDWIEIGKEIWVSIFSKDDDEPIEYLPGFIENINGEEIKVVYDNSNGPHIVLIKNILPRINITDVSLNLNKLETINDAQILNQLQYNFQKKEIFLFCGNSTLFINPYKIINNLENEELKREYILSLNKDENYCNNLRPHIWNIALHAFKCAKFNNKKQIILISGESGAGKTEATKRAMDILINLKNLFNTNENHIGKTILKCNPLLEAFGNCKTIKNDNSSRFGKFISLFFDKESNQIEGIKIKNFLLEKSRITSPNLNERNFHIFYSILKENKPKFLSKYFLYNEKNNVLNAEYFNILKKTGITNDKNIDDTIIWKEILSTFDLLKLSDIEIEGILRIIVCILFLGNLEFDEENYKEGKDPCKIIKNEDWNKVIKLLDINENVFEKLLTCKKLKTYDNEIFVPFKPKDINLIISAISKELYEKCFEWLILKINSIFEPKSNYERLNEIGIWDIFGFEIFKINGIEQFCINFINEKLHNLYINFIFIKEYKIFEDEGLKDYITYIKFKNNIEIIELIEKPQGILSLIDNSCQLNKNHSHLLETLKINKNEKLLKFHKMNKNVFILKHTARDVEYTITDFIEKNKDEIPGNLFEIINLSMSQIKYIYYGIIFENDKLIFEENVNDNIINKDNIQNKKKSKFLSQKLKVNIKSLIDNLNDCDNHFLRCIKPNEIKQSEIWNQNLVLLQIRYMGILDSLKIQKESYPFKINYKEFFSKYKELNKNNTELIISLKKIHKEDLNFKKLSEDLVYETEGTFDKKNFLFGKTKIFLSNNIKNKYDSLIREKYKNKISSINLIISVFKEKNKILKINKYYDLLENKKNNCKKILDKWECLILYNNFKISLDLIKKMKENFKNNRQKREKKTNCFYIKLIESLILRNKIESITYKNYDITRKITFIRDYYSHKRYLVEKRELKEYIFNHIFDGVWKILEFRLKSGFILNIQRFIRGYLDLKRTKMADITIYFKDYIKKLNDKNKSILINKNIKMYLAKIKYNRLKRATFKIQGFFRSKYLGFYFEIISAAANMIQKWYKKYIIRRNKLKEYEKKFKKKYKDYIKNYNDFENNNVFSKNIYQDPGLINVLDKNNILEENINFGNYNFKKMIPIYVKNKKLYFFLLLIDIECYTDLNYIYEKGWSYNFNEIIKNINNIKERIINIEVGDSFSTIITNESKVYTWGINDYGQLLADTKNSKFNILKFSTNNNPKFLYNSNDYSITWDYSNNLIKWGNLQKNNLILNNKTKKLCYMYSKYEKIYCIEENNKELFEIFIKNNNFIYKEINIDYKIIQIEVGINFTIFLSEKGRVFSTGKNNFGQLGLNKENTFETKKLCLIDYFYLNKIKIIEISVGLNFVLCISNNNNLYTWGRNNNLSLFNIKEDTLIKPVKLELNSKIISISCLSKSFFILTNEYELYKISNEIKKWIDYKKYFDEENYKYIPLKIYSKFSKSLGITYLYFTNIKENNKNINNNNKKIQLLNKELNTYANKIYFENIKPLNNYIDLKYLKNTMENNSKNILKPILKDTNLYLSFSKIFEKNIKNTYYKPIIDKNSKINFTNKKKIDTYQPTKIDIKKLNKDFMLKNESLIEENDIDSEKENFYNELDIQNEKQKNNNFLKSQRNIEEILKKNPIFWNKKDLNEIKNFEKF